ncbi:MULTISPECIES: stage V sporulation protein B [Thermoactinomyces]|uniref:Stage V sporulation protein B n=1 Tax=Thermoactinomyces daqus TaxID=1329516 RepID=A0A7W2AH49_9BACL|nr:stage V sporulation protein B [Thermoactinomyces daqus]MBA4541349.1 stage V sporulation protein B [Thermoactinomyces daqus]MBH8596822.1 stage V sporulation protein B [Thermoactinomyces sp. CICC 10523]MBH8606747.1 stage V sporulation protein B [Thermoactinomyces sp. CICC 10521]
MNKGFLRGTLILVGAGLITKVLGFVYRIALSRIIGDEGMGLFQMAFPILVFTIVVTTAGLPVAISKLVSEAEAKGEEERIRSILIVSVFIVIITSTVITASVLLGAPWIAKTLLTDERAIYALLGIAPIIPIIAVSSIFRGYFQGRQNMSPYAFSTIVEQSVRIFTVLLLAKYLLPYGIEFAAAGAMIGMVIGEFTGMVYLLYSFKKDPTRPRLRLIFSRQPSVSTRGKKGSYLSAFGRTVRALLRLAIPVTASRLVGSFSYAIEPIVVSQSLALAGYVTATATALYGQLEGMAIPITFFPAFITYALSVSLVPAISEAEAQNNQRLVEHRLQQAIRLSLIVTAPCALLLFLLAEPLSVLLFRQADVARLIQIMAPFTIIHALQGPFASVLQGLDRANLPMRNSIIGALIKTVLILLLASRPELGIDGVALAINCGIVIVTSLHFIDIVRLIPFSIRVKEYGKLILAVVVTGFAAYQGMALTKQMSLLSSTLLIMAMSMGVYLCCLIFLSLIRKEDVLRIPVIGKWMAFLLPQ